jgi:flagellar biogenesis protein FliO
VLVLILLGVWVLKLFARAGTSVVSRGRNRRLAVIDQVMVDQRASSSSSAATMSSTSS